MSRAGGDPGENLERAHPIVKRSNNIITCVVGRGDDCIIIIRDSGSNKRGNPIGLVRG